MDALEVQETPVMCNNIIVKYLFIEFYAVYGWYYALLFIIVRLLRVQYGTKNKRFWKYDIAVGWQMNEIKIFVLMGKKHCKQKKNTIKVSIIQHLNYL